MSSAANIPVRFDAPSLSHDEWWALFDQLRLSQQPDYAEYGGPVAFFRKERDADSDNAAGATGEDLRWALDHAPYRPPDPGDELEA